MRITFVSLWSWRRGPAYLADFTYAVRDIDAKGA